MSEKTIGVLAVMVTLLGFVLFLLAIFFLLRGDKLPKEAGSPHRIKYAGLEISTDRVVMLCLLFGLMIVVPLVGSFILQDRDGQRKAAAEHDKTDCDARVEPIAKELNDLKQTQLRVFATVSGSALSEKQAELVRVRAGQPDKLECEKKNLVNGGYRCVAALNAFNDVFELHVLDSSQKVIGSEQFTPVEHQIVLNVGENP